MRKAGYSTLYNFLQYNKKLFFCLGLIWSLGACQNPKGFIRNMEGKWSGPTSGEGMGFEEWNPADLEDEAFGFAWVIEDSDTVFKEKFALVKKQKGYVYIAYPNMTQNPTEFQLKKVGRKYLEVENLKHDFPRNIQYRIQGDSVEIILTGEYENHEVGEERYWLKKWNH